MTKVVLPMLPPCNECGACCTRGWLISAYGINAELPGIKEMVNERGYMNKKGNGECIAFDDKTKLCTIYENRPSACKKFKRGNAQCRTAFVEKYIEPL